jgi:5-formyltetrahydrofolate cyclo-ligase
MHSAPSGDLDAKMRLRSAMKAERRALPDALRRIGASQIAAHGLRFLAGGDAAMVEQKPVVSGFLSIGDELDTDPLLQSLHADGFPLCLPVMRGKRNPLIFRSWQPGDTMGETLWGIREPEAHRAVVVPRILLVPLLAFDRAGYRLGYGGGYYDRTLRGLRSTGAVVAVGLAFDEQEVDAVPHLDYDERIDWVLTPSGARKCTG